METIISAPLSRALHDSTMAAHEQAENASFITRLMNGEGTPEGLVALLRQSLPVYEALEDACRRAGTDPRLSAILDPRLDRADALRADLESHRAQGRTYDLLVPATEAYVAELHACATDPAALIGHHYVRYLGDLTDLRTGDKTAKDIEFATDAGSISGIQIEAAGRAMRDRLASFRLGGDDSDSSAESAVKADARTAGQVSSDAGPTKQEEGTMTKAFHKISEVVSGSFSKKNK